jgi:hypothetical protein
MGGFRSVVLRHGQSTSQGTARVLPTCVCRTRRLMLADQKSATDAANKHWDEAKGVLRGENAVKRDKHHGRTLIG